MMICHDIMIAEDLFLELLVAAGQVNSMTVPELRGVTFVDSVTAPTWSDLRGRDVGSECYELQTFCHQLEEEVLARLQACRYLFVYRQSIVRPTDNFFWTSAVTCS